MSTPKKVQFLEIYRFFRNLEESNEYTPGRLYMACDEEIKIKRIYSFYEGRRAPLGWEKGLIEQRIGKVIPWRACRPPQKKEAATPDVHAPTLWERRRELTR